MRDVFEFAGSLRLGEEVVTWRSIEIAQSVVQDAVLETTRDEMLQESGREAVTMWIDDDERRAVFGRINEPTTLGHGFARARRATEEDVLVLHRFVIP